MPIVFTIKVILIGSGIIVAAQSMGKASYSFSLGWEILKATVALLVVLTAAWKMELRKYIAFSFILSSVYGAGHIVYDYSNFLINDNALLFSPTIHFNQALVSLGCAAIGVALLKFKLDRKPG